MALAPTLLEYGKNIIERIFPDPIAQAKERAEAMQKVTEEAMKERSEERTAQLQRDIAQLDVNKTEAASGDKFASRWRPAVGWICVAALAYTFIFRPLFSGVMMNLFSWTELPQLDIEELMTILAAMLGFGGLRTVEKIKDKA